MEIWEQRDVKGLYKKARKGLIKNLIDDGDPYEVPINSDLDIKTGDNTIQECAQQWIDFLINKDILGLNSDENQFIKNIDEKKENKGHRSVSKRNEQENSPDLRNKASKIVKASISSWKVTCMNKNTEN